MATPLRIQSPSPLSRVATKVSVSRQHSDSSLSSPKLSLISRFSTFHKELYACSFASQSTSSPIYVKRAAGLQSNDDHDEKDDEKRAVRTLLIDNYDSYTYNIYQELAVVNRVPPVVIHNDEWSWEDIHHILYNENAFDNIVISPGPGSPACPKDIGVCLQILSHCADIPVLGVCLGHQALGYVYGAKVVHAPEPIHGRLSEIVHDGCNLFLGIPSGKKAGFKVMRYHSLVIAAESLPRELIPIAWTASAKTHSLSEAEQSEVLPGLELQGNKLLQFGNLLATPELAGSADVEMSNTVDNDKILMGVMHSSKPHYGVQFHPESIATSHRRQIFENFKRMTADYGLRSSLHPLMKAPCTPRSYKEFPLTKLLHDEAIISNQKSLCAKYLKLQWKKIDCLAGQVGGPENIFCSLFGDKNAQNTFWLDSSSTDKGRARFSFMGGKGGPLWKQITFHIFEKRPGGRISIQDTHGQVKTEFSSGGFFHFLDKELNSFRFDKEDYEGLPFDFCGGFVGYIGYNLKIECGALSNAHKSILPDACFFFSDNLVVIDHNNDDVYILHVYELLGSQERFKEESWLTKTENKLLSLKGKKIRQPSKQKAGELSIPGRGSFSVDRSKHQYMKDIEKCLQLIRDGESYELCLTTQARKKVEDINSLNLYLNLRRKNPAPYAAWLNFACEDLCICSSSPERFLRLDEHGILEAKPIKGTVSRGSTFVEDDSLRLQLQYSEKNQAENLMIVDLLRNDLGRVCEPGSVCVPKLMEVQTYASVHTLVSTIQGKKRLSKSVVDCIKAAFPGGSMTGAPKLRSMELLDAIETSSRGIYSGSIGFISYNQTFDLNIVIRTIVIHKGEVSIGAGGAIVALSDPEEEYEEMMLKASAPTKAVEECIHSNFD